MASKFTKMILAFAVVTAAMMAGCSEDGGKPQKQQQEQQLKQQQVKKLRWDWKMKVNAKILFWKIMSKRIKFFWEVRNLVRTGACKAVEACHVKKN